MRRLPVLVALVVLAVFFAVGGAVASTPGGDVRLTNDCHPDPGCGAGYVSAYTLATGVPYTDATLDECTISHGRQNEPAVAVDPRNTSVLLGSSNDYCGVYNANDADGHPIPVGPIWLGYYRSENAGSSFVSSLVPGYPDDASPYGAIAKRQVRTAGSGDPVIAWDAQGRAFFGSESSDDPAGTPKTFGDAWVATFDNPGGPTGDPQNDGKRYRQTVVVARGSSAPNLLGKFNDKTAIEADHNSDGRCDNDVYFSWSRFTGNAGGVSIYFSRSTDHGVTFGNPRKVSQTISDVQFPDIAVTGNSNVYLVFRSFASGRGSEGNSIYYVRSTDCGATFTRPQLLQDFIPNDAQDASDPEAAPPQSARTIPGSKRSRARPETPAIAATSTPTASPATPSSAATRSLGRPRISSTPRILTASTSSTTPRSPGPKLPPGRHTGRPSQASAARPGIFFLRVNGANGTKVGPSLIDAQPIGHQIFPDISADNPSASSRGTLHAIWWDSRNDGCYSVTRPIGNCANRTTVPSLDAWGASSTNFGASWAPTRLSDVTSNPNYEQFADRTVPFAGDYLYVSSVNDFAFGVWTDWRDTLQGIDPREDPEDEDGATADVHQCRVFADGAWSGDRCPHDRGLDQNIYGDLAP